MGEVVSRSADNPVAAGQSNEITPLPWRSSLPDDTTIIGADNTDVADMDGDFDDEYARLKANTAFILRACNSHAALVQALEELLAASLLDSRRDAAKMANARENARCALRLAKGEE